MWCDPCPTIFDRRLADDILDEWELLFDTAFRGRHTVLEALYHSDHLRSEVLASLPSPSWPQMTVLQRVFAFLASSE